MNGIRFLLEITWVQRTKTDGIFSHVSISGKKKCTEHIKYIIHCIGFKKRDLFSRNLLLNAKNDTIFDDFDRNRMKERKQIYFWKEIEHVFLGIWITFKIEVNRKTVKYYSLNKLNITGWEMWVRAT